MLKKLAIQQTASLPTDLRDKLVDLFALLGIDTRWNAMLLNDLEEQGHCTIDHDFRPNWKKVSKSVITALENRGVQFIKTDKGTYIQLPDA